MNLLAAKAVYLIGIKGAGMTALAELLMRHGVVVSGSDTEEVFYTDAVLKRLGITVYQPFAATNVSEGATAFVYSTAYTQDNNEELRLAFATGKPIFSYPEALGLLTQNKLTIAVCGTHGKTTTTALLADVLQGMEFAPSAIVGSEIKRWGGGALAGDGQYLVIEADEYQDKLRYYHPLAVVLTSVAWDHPDFFPTVTEYEAVFERFVARIPRHGVLIANGDDARVRVVAEHCPSAKVFYGLLEGNDVRVVDISVIDPESPEGKRGLRQRFSVEHQGKRLGPFTLRLAGKHNAENAGAVIALALSLKLPFESLAHSLELFTGTKRRFELIGEYQGALIFDDYAHHPDEIRVTLTAFRELYPNRSLKVIFHPHTYTRTKALLPDFAETLSAADQVYLLDIYGSARETQGGVMSSDLVERINQVYPGKAFYTPNRSELVKTLHQELGPRDLVVTMGAGDVWQVAETLVHSSST